MQTVKLFQFCEANSKSFNYITVFNVVIKNLDA